MKKSGKNSYAGFTPNLNQSDEYDSNIEIYTSQDNQTIRNYAKKIQKDKINEEQYRKKITEQAQRLTNLETYKNLCERRIRQLVPNHPLPVRESDLKNITELYKKDSKDFNNMIEAKDNEILQLNRKINNLENKIKNFDNDKYTYKTNNNTIDFPTVDKIPNDRIKEAYQRIYNYAIELNMDRYSIMESLRHETINNEEQRNYIEILKQTIESNIIKHGLGPVLNSYRQGRDISNIDIICDISKAGSEVEKYRKDLIMSQVLISELKQENEYIKKLNEDMNIKKEKIKETLDHGIFELDEAKSTVNKLEIEKDEINKKYEELKKASEKMRSEFNNTLDQLNIYEQDLNEKEKIIIDLRNKIESLDTRLKDLEDYENKYNIISKDVNSIMKEKIFYENECNNRIDNINEKESELKRMRIMLQENYQYYEDDKKSLLNDISNLNNEIKNYENINITLSGRIKDLETENKSLIEKLSNSERSMKDYKFQHEAMKTLYDEYRKNTDKDLENNDKYSKELNNDLNNLREQMNVIKKEKDNLYENNIRLKNDNSRLDNEVNILNKELAQIRNDNAELNRKIINNIKEHHKINDENQNLKSTNDMLNSDLKYLKDKYEKDSNITSNEINLLNIDISNSKREINLIKQQLSEKNELISSYELKIDNLNSIIKIKDLSITELNLNESRLNKLNEDLTNRLDIIKKDKEDLSNNIDELMSKNKDLNQHIVCIENGNIDKDKLIYMLEDEKRKLMTENKEINYKIDEFYKRVEKSSSELDREMKNNFELNNNQHILNLKYERLEKEMKIILDERDKLDLQRKRLIEDIEKLSMSERNNQINITTLKKINNDFRQSFQNISNANKSFIHNILQHIKEDIFSNSFLKNIKDYESSLIDNNEKTISENTRYITDFIRTLSTELEICYDRINQNKDALKETSNKLKNIESSIHYQINDEKKIDNLKNSIYNKQLSDEVDRLIYEKESLLIQNEKLNNEIISIKFEYEKIEEDLNNKKFELVKLNAMNSELMHDNNKMNNILRNYNIQTDALEDRILMINKEKKYIEELILKLAKYNLSCNISQIVNEIIITHECLSQLQRDKIKISNNISYLELEFIQNEEKNSELIYQMKSELDQLKHLLHDYNKKIDDKKYKLNDLELELNKIPIQDNFNNHTREDKDHKRYNLKNKMNFSSSLEYQETDIKSGSYFYDSKFSNDSLMNSGYTRRPLSNFSENY